MLWFWSQKQRSGKNSRVLYSYVYEWGNTPKKRPPGKLLRPGRTCSMTKGPARMEKHCGGIMTL